MRKLLSVLALAGACLATAAQADVTLTDTGFTDIDTTVGPGHTFTAITGGLSGAFGACGACGNPGVALQITVSGQAGDGVVVGIPLLDMVFDPGTQGSILSIDASVDKNFVLSDAGSFNNSFRPLILQNGNYYEAAILDAPFSFGAGGGSTGYISFSGNLTAADFAMVNTTTGAFDASSHPDFTSGPMTFGILAILGPLALANTVELDYDNFGITLHTASTDVPEPLTLSLFGAGLAGAAAMRRRKRA